RVIAVRRPQGGRLGVLDPARHWRVDRASRLGLGGDDFTVGQDPYGIDLSRRRRSSERRHAQLRVIAQLRVLGLERRVRRSSQFELWRGPLPTQLLEAAGGDNRRGEEDEG